MILVLRNLAILLLAAATPLDEPDYVTVFKAPGSTGQPSIRIPALLCTTKGTLLAFAEGRNGHADQASNDLVLSRSTDGGKSWSKAKVVVAEGEGSVNNPTVVQDRKSGRIFLHFHVFPTGAKEFDKLAPGPKGATRMGCVTSDDDARTWSDPIDLNAALKPDNATTVAQGPGIGIQLERGPHAGRLLVPCNSQDEHKAFVNWMAISDDGGASWRRGQNVPQEGMQLNEVQVSETRDGSVYLNSRQWRGTGGRKAAWSTDGGETWSQAIEDQQLPEPVCQGSLISWHEKDRHCTLFLNPEGEPPGKGRKRGTVRLSLDGGKTWPVSKPLVPGPFAYSSMARLKNGRIGVLYEPAGDTEIRFLTFDMAWLEKAERETAPGSAKK
ncbi:MAG: exo-alpha-sialidase [Planctomycetes bacterium]|nr:exo-alpha-sialidase [Planctomycetota bacterium]